MFGNVAPDDIVIDSPTEDAKNIASDWAQVDADMVRALRTLK